MKSLKKIFALSLLGISLVVFVPAAHAQSAPELNDQIDGLLEEITALKIRLAGVSATSDSVSPSCEFNRNLAFGSVGEDVRCLQRYLNEQGYLLASFGPGSLGNETAFFGPLTKAALVTYQTDNAGTILAPLGLSVGTGFFGSSTQAHLLAVRGSLGGATDIEAVSDQGLEVRLVARPDGTSVALAGAGQITAGQFSFTAPTSTNVSLSGLAFRKLGTLFDSQIRSMYLVDVARGEVVAEFQSLASGIATFSSLNFNVTAGAVRTLELRFDLAGQVVGGETIGWELTRVNTGLEKNVSGLPLATELLTVSTASSSTIASVSVAANEVATNLAAGTNNARVAQWIATVAGGPVSLKNLTLTFSGDANPSDIRNLRLLLNGVEVSGKAQASSKISFVVSGSAVLAVGENTIQVFADITGSPNRTMQVELSQPYDVYAYDITNNSGVAAVLVGDSSLITIDSGATRLQLATGSPTQSIPAGASAVTIGKFSLYAAGEPMRVKFLDAMLIQEGSFDWSINTNVIDDLSNIRLIDDAGNQIGSTISRVLSGSGSGKCSLLYASITCHFGSATAPLEYVVPVNTTRIFSLQADIGKNTDLETLSGSLVSGKENLEGQVSFQILSSANADAPVRSVSSAIEDGVINP